MDKRVIADLRERVAKATEPDRDIDGRLMAAFEPPMVRGFEAPFDYFVCINDDDQGVFKPYRGTTPASVDKPVRDYTSSIDDALALVERVLPGWDFSLYRDDGVYAVEMDWPDGALTPEQAYFPPVGRAATRPLAILAALLSALSDDGGPHAG